MNSEPVSKASYEDLSRFIRDLVDEGTRTLAKKVASGEITRDSVVIHPACELAYEDLAALAEDNLFRDWYEKHL